MSRIFDALRRSERDRPEAGPVALPEGPELLKHAESHVASARNGASLVEEPKLPPENGRRTVREVGLALVGPPVAGQSAEESAPFFGQFQSLPMALSAQSRLVCVTDREGPTAEALRLLAVRLRDFRRTKPLKKVLITSTIPQEGKSTIAANLACALSRSTDERTLLIEGDLRRPSLSRIFGIHPPAGLCECLRGEAAPHQGICRLDDAGLWYLPAGRAPGNPLELLQSQKLTALMDRLAAYFDWIVIDSPPVLPLADASIWMTLADGILLVARLGTTEKHQLKKGLEALQPSKVLGAVMNSSAASAYSGYYYRSPNPSA